MDGTVKNEQWDVAWRDHQGQLRTLMFELGRGLRYRVIIHNEADKDRFLKIFLRPPATALLSADGGLLGNIKVDENLLLPLSYRGVDADFLESRVLELLARCGLNEAQARQLLTCLPYQLSAYQRRLVGFVRSVLLQPKVMVYASIWHGVSQAEIAQLVGFDEILRSDAPTCTRVFVDYDTDIKAALPAQQTFYL